MLNRDGTATVEEEIFETSEYRPYREFKYTYNTDKNEIYMRLEKSSLFDFLGFGNSLYSFNESIYKIDEYYTVDNVRKEYEEYYNKNKDKESFKEEYPNCNNYEDYINAIIKKSSFNSLSEIIAAEKEESKYYLDIEFRPLTTYTYSKDKNGKMTLIEKFTGINNIRDSKCSYNRQDIKLDIYSGTARFYIKNNYSFRSFSVDANKKEIVFVNEDDKDDKITATYKENINAETVTVTIKDGDYTGTYICEFEGATYTQE